MRRFLLRLTLIVFVLIGIFLAFPIIIVPSHLPIIQAMFDQDITDQIAPQDVSLTNITTVSFTITWTTATPTTTTITYGSDPRIMSQIITTPDPITNHRLTISRLKPATIYYFNFTTNKIIFTNNNLPFQVTTWPTSHSPEAPDDGSSPTIYELTLPEVLEPAANKLATLKQLHQQGLDKLMGK